MNHLSKRSAKSAASTRQGGAFLLLVMMLLIVIVSATQWLVSGSVANRQGENNRLRARSMIAAMDQAQALASDWQVPLRLPIDESLDERIEVVASDDRSSLTAIWLRGEMEIARLTRPVDSPLDQTRSAEKLDQDAGKQ